MRDRLLLAVSAVARVVLVVVAFGLAVGSIGLVSVRGFCPEPGQGGAALAAPDGAAPLATIVEEPAGDVDPNSPAPDEQGPDAERPTDQAPTDQAPAGDAPAGDAPAGDAPADDGACPGGVQRCLPPLWSSVLILGEPACHDQAPEQLRGTLLPSFIGATVMLAAAWWLRPRRLRARRREDRTFGKGRTGRTGRTRRTTGTTGPTRTSGTSRTDGPADTNR